VVRQRIATHPPGVELARIALPGQVEASGHLSQLARGLGRPDEAGIPAFAGFP
jgi:hypothetical protein